MDKHGGGRPVVVNKLISEPPVIKHNDYVYFKKLFGGANTQHLFGDLQQTIRKIKKEFNKEISFKEQPEDIRLIERKEEFKQDIILGNTLRHQIKHKPPKPPQQLRPLLQVNRNVIKIQITPYGDSCPSSDPSQHEIGIQVSQQSELDNPFFKGKRKPKTVQVQTEIPPVTTKQLPQNESTKGVFAPGSIVSEMDEVDLMKMYTLKPKDSKGSATRGQPIVPVKPKELR